MHSIILCLPSPPTGSGQAYIGTGTCRRGLQHSVLNPLTKVASRSRRPFMTRLRRSRRGSTVRLPISACLLVPTHRRTAKNVHAGLLSRRYLGRSRCTLRPHACSAPIHGTSACERPDARFLRSIRLRDTCARLRLRRRRRRRRRLMCRAGCPRPRIRRHGTVQKWPRYGRRSGAIVDGLSLVEDLRRSSMPALV
ncbi:hypothetical protein BJV78DRAFT_722775 [Lactifluus subvellereus]|nr:hypothetical protein BJV78DRAFT_722775 [Lactifluus subvellereus]